MSQEQQSTGESAKASTSGMLTERTLSALISALRYSETDFAAEDVADILYLAAVQRLAASRAPSPAEARQRAPDYKDHDILAGDKERRDPGGQAKKRSASSGSADASSREGGETRSSGAADVPLFAPSTGTGTAPDKGLPVLVPGVRALPDHLGIARALRPLKRRILSRTQTALDEAASARAIADTGGEFWIPVLSPTKVRWMDVVLVFDAAISMSVWRQTLDEFRYVLEREGAFRDVRVCYLDCRARQPDESLRSRLSLERGDLPPVLLQDRRTLSHPEQLTNPAGYRAILVVSDCTAAAWRDGRVARLLALWGRRHPVAVVQMLPEERWIHTGLGTGQRSVLSRPTGSQPGEPMRVNRANPASRHQERALVPIVTLAPESLRDYAAFLTRGGTTACVVAYSLRTSPPAERTGRSTRQPDVSTSTSAVMRVERAQALLTPVAWRLVHLLAASPLHLPVMQMLQRLMLPESGPQHLAELVLSGLIRPLRVDEEDHLTRALSGGRRDVGPPSFAFRDGVRELLLAQAAVPNSIDVFNTVSRYIGARFKIAPVEFQALLGDPHQSYVALAARSSAFAEIAPHLLRRLGGSYAHIADRFVGAANKATSPARPSATPGEGVVSGAPTEAPRVLGRIEISILPVTSGDTLLMLSGTPWPHAHSASPFPIEQEFDDNDTARTGRRLYDTLCTNRGIALTLEEVRNLEYGVACPIFIKVNMQLAQELPWETLCDPDGRFLALDRRSPIVRQGVQQDPSRIGMPLRVMAVFGFTTAPMAPHWDAIVNSFAKDDRSIRFRILLNDDALFEHVGREADERVAASFIGSRPQDLIEEVARWRPNILHLVCPGDSAFGSSQLRVGTRSDYAKEVKESIVLEPEALIGHSEVRRALCLLTLSDYMTPARFAALGVPAVIGPRRDTTLEDTERFTHAFFRALSRALSRVDRQVPDFAIDLTDLLYETRRELADRGLSQGSTWSVPALYTSNLTIRVARSPEVGKLLAELETLRAFRKDLNQPGLPSRLVEEFDKHIREVEQQLRDASGAAPGQPEPIASNLAPASEPIEATAAPPTSRVTKPARSEDLSDWKDPRVGWGIVLPDRNDLSREELANGADAPEPIRRLLFSRGFDNGPAPVFRYRPQLNRLLRRYGDQVSEIPVSGGQRGVGPGKLPFYLLLCGSPLEIPWELQSLLTVESAVGRLDLQGQALDNYVNALLNGWSKAVADRTAPLVWAPFGDKGDLARLQRNAIAAPLFQAFAADTAIGRKARLFDGDYASIEALIRALVEQHPGLIVTGSSRQFPPATEPERVVSDSGAIVDNYGQLLSPDGLFSQWLPDGAIWFAYSSYSAGVWPRHGQNSPDMGDPMATQVGSSSAPLPSALLGAPEPLRAFIGSVGPILDPLPNAKHLMQFLTTPLREALYQRLYSPEPIGLALRRFYWGVGKLYAEMDQIRRGYERGEERDDTSSALAMARSIQNIMLLGDPTVTLTI